MKRRLSIRLVTIALLATGIPSSKAPWFPTAIAEGTSAAAAAPLPLLSKGRSVDWWFVFKFNAATFSECSGPEKCPFGGTLQTYKAGKQFVYASSAVPALQLSTECAGEGTNDPLGATFDEIYNGSFFYVLWNDQFYGDPRIAGCSKSCGSPWGHSKGLIAWNEAGEGVVLQVTTPSWPAAGSKTHPRKTDGNTLGCVTDNDVLVSQHFFALKLTRADLLKVLTALHNASAVTDTGNAQIVKNGGPSEVQELVKKLGTKSKDSRVTKDTLSSGVLLISKPSALHVPPWQMVSALLGGVSLRTATWWAKPKIPTTTDSTEVSCWSDDLGKPGPVEIATTGNWGGKSFGLRGGAGPNFNHAKIGTSTTGDAHYVIFGDMNQQGALAENCGSSQNGRGGLFYVVTNDTLFAGVTKLIEGESAPASEAP